MRDNPENIPEIWIKDWVSGSLAKGSSVSLAFDRRHLTHVEFLFYYRCRSTRISLVLMPTFVTVKITTGSFFFFVTKRALFEVLCVLRKGRGLRTSNTSVSIMLLDSVRRMSPGSTNAPEVDVGECEEASCIC